MKRCFLLSLMVVGLSAYANNAHANDTATIDGYKLHGCTTGGGKNYCTTDKKEISKIIGKSKELKTANFAQNKKLVQLFYQGKNSPITDIFVIDDKAKSIYLYPQFAWFDWSIEEKQTYPKRAPKVISNKKSNTFCLHQPYAWFDSYEQEGQIVTRAIVEYDIDDELRYVCTSFDKYGDKEFTSDELIKAKDYLKMVK